MAEILSEEQISGAATPQGVTPRVVASGNTLNEEQITGRGPMEEEAAAINTWKGAAQDIAGGIGKRLAGTAAQVSDMFTGIGKSLLGVPVYWGARNAVVFKGEDAKTAGTAGQLAKEAMLTGSGILELIRAKKLLTEEQIAQVLDPAAMTGQGRSV